MVNQVMLRNRRRLKEHLVNVWSNRKIHTYYIPANDQDELIAHDYRKQYIIKDFIKEEAAKR